MSDTESDNEDSIQIRLSDRVKDLLPILEDEQLGFNHLITRKAAKKLVKKRVFPDNFNLKIPTTTKAIEGVDAKIKDERIRFEKDLFKIHARLHDTMVVLLDAEQMMDSNMDLEEREEEQEDEDENEEEEENNLIVRNAQSVFNRFTDAIKLINFTAATISIARTNNIEATLGIVPRPLIVDEKVSLISKERLQEIYAAKKKEQKINDILSADKKKRKSNKQHQQQQQQHNNQQAHGSRGNGSFRGRGGHRGGRGRVEGVGSSSLVPEYNTRSNDRAPSNIHSDQATTTREVLEQSPNGMSQQRDQLNAEGRSNRDRSTRGYLKSTPVNMLLANVHHSKSERRNEANMGWKGGKQTDKKPLVQNGWFIRCGKSLTKGKLHGQCRYFKSLLSRTAEKEVYRPLQIHMEEHSLPMEGSPVRSLDCTKSIHTSSQTNTRLLKGHSPNKSHRVHRRYLSDSINFRRVQKKNADSNKYIRRLRFSNKQRKINIGTSTISGLLGGDYRFQHNGNEGTKGKGPINCEGYKQDNQKEPSHHSSTSRTEGISDSSKVIHEENKPFSKDEIETLSRRLGLRNSTPRRSQRRTAGLEGSIDQLEWQGDKLIPTFQQHSNEKSSFKANLNDFKLSFKSLYNKLKKAFLMQLKIPY
ncbi:hypothetical protein ACTFIR_000015 [Dictyostelium discoideum]